MHLQLQTMAIDQLKEIMWSCACMHIRPWMWDAVLHCVNLCSCNSLNTCTQMSDNLIQGSVHAHDRSIISSTTYKYYT